MKINILNKDTETPLLDRLLKVRGITCSIENFLNPTLQEYWISQDKLHDMDKAVSIIFSHIDKGNKIMIFGDYDVDGITSSFCLYTFVTKYLNYNNISIMYPDRLKDGYWLKNKHIDMMLTKKIDLIITVDNGITSIGEASYAKEKGIALVITDHHHALDTLPEADALVNPQVSPDYEFKWIAWVWVAFKVINALMDKADFSQETKKEIFEYFLPLVAIWTVADCVPLVHENRAIVKRWLDIMNYEKSKIPESLLWFLNHLNIKDNLDTFHIGFLIWPRINAWGRLASPVDSLRTLLFTGEKQKEYLINIDNINNERKKMQDKAHKHAIENLNTEHNIIIATDESYHEWIVWIVSWRLTEQHNKPSMVLHINEKKWTAVGSLRAPEYFSVIEMLKTADHLLDRYWWHKQAWWLSVQLSNLEELKTHFIDYANKNISDNDLEKTINIDTQFLHHERESDILSQIDKLAPFGVWNQEPIFLIENCKVLNSEKVGQRWKWHLKLTIELDWQRVTKALQRSKWDTILDYTAWAYVNILWKIKTDAFSGGYFIECKEIIK